MAEDREVLREVWQGRIPVAFSLSSDDVHTMGQPDPYHLMLPRLSYITVIFDKVCILLTLVTLEMVSIKRRPKNKITCIQ
jgi:hypothetical protein